MSILLYLTTLGHALSGHVYSGVQINVVKVCLNDVLVHTTFDDIYLGSRVDS